MSSIDNIVTLNISRSAAAVSRQGFGVALILGDSASGWAGDRIRSYTSPAAMLDDGFTVDDPEYIEAVALYAQDVKPVRFKVGVRAAADVAQVSTLTPNITSQQIQDFWVKINGTEFRFTSDANPTAAEVVTGLNALINAGNEPATASGSVTTVLTSDDAGIPFTITQSSNLTTAPTTPNSGVGTDLSAIQAIDNDWYGLILCDDSNGAILGAAAWIETQRKVFIASTGADAVATAGSSDIASRLKAKSFNRTALIYSEDYASGAAGAVAGNFLPRTPGSWTLKFKSLVGIAVDALSDTKVTVAKSKNANVYTMVGGAGMLEDGVVASGEFLDVIVGIDWIHANMQSDIFQALRDSPKLPYTNAGAGVIEAIIRTRLQLATTASILANDPAPVVVVPLVSEQDPGDKAVRKLGGITFKATLAGAVHSTKINGYVSV